MKLQELSDLLHELEVAKRDPCLAGLKCLDSARRELDRLKAAPWASEKLDVRRLQIQKGKQHGIFTLLFLRWLHHGRDWNEKRP